MTNTVREADGKEKKKNSQDVSGIGEKKKKKKKKGGGGGSGGI